MIQFEWDHKKDLINQRKHHLSFEEAKTAFYDENASLFFDEDHSQEEERYILLGLSEDLKTLVVTHCYIEDRNTIRLISARRATKKEREYYYQR
jgi:uncharacterized protein